MSPASESPRDRKRDEDGLGHAANDVDHDAAPLVREAMS